MTETIQDLEPAHRIGPLLFLTEKLKLGLITEAKTWKHAYGRNLNDKCAREMDEILDFFDQMRKKLSRPVTDLDDIRSHMNALMEIRDNEIRIDMTITPIEEAYGMLHKYNLSFNDGNAERVDQLSYGWKLLQAQVFNMLGPVLQVLSKPWFASFFLQHLVVAFGILCSCITGFASAEPPDPDSAQLQR